MRNDIRPGDRIWRVILWGCLVFFGLLTIALVWMGIHEHSQRQTLTGLVMGLLLCVRTWFALKARRARNDVH